MEQGQQPAEEAIYRALLKEIRMLIAEREVTQEYVAEQLRARGHDARRETFSGYLNGTTKKGMPATVLISVADILGEDLGALTRRAIDRARKEQ